MALAKRTGLAGEERMTMTANPRPIAIASPIRTPLISKLLVVLGHAYRVT
jgi:hypothetical protein